MNCKNILLLLTLFSGALLTTSCSDDLEAETELTEAKTRLDELNAKEPLTAKEQSEKKALEGRKQELEDQAFLSKRGSDLSNSDAYNKAMFTSLKQQEKATELVEGLCKKYPTGDIDARMRPLGKKHNVNDPIRIGNALGRLSGVISGSLDLYILERHIKNLKNVQIKNQVKVAEFLGAALTAFTNNNVEKAIRKLEEANKVSG